MKVQVGEIESQAMSGIVRLVEISGHIQLAEIMEYHITDECLNIQHHWNT